MSNDTQALKTDAPSKGPQGRGVVASLVFLFEKIMPDPFVLSIGLTLLVVVLASAFAPKGDFPNILTVWFTGTFGILAFALQMILILATGFAIADAASVQRALRALAARVETPRKAALVIFPVVAVAAWLNWGLGLVVGALLAREIAKRTRVDFAWLVAGSYSAWSICNSGLSSSIALSQASHGNALNFVAKATGHVVPLTQTIFAPFVLVPTIAVVVVMMLVFIRIHPADADIVAFSGDTAAAAAASHGKTSDSNSFAGRAERSVIGTLLLLALGLSYVGLLLSRGEFELDINMTILLFFLIGLAFQRTPIAYADSIRRAAHQTGSMLLQYPMYGGIMGIMRGTGLAAAISKGFVAVATPATLPLWSFLSSLIITLLIPSAGGHWAVDGPFVVPAALALKASVPHSIMGVAMAENVSNMLQPFWAVPVVAIAGIRIQRVMGYTAITFAVSLVIYSLSLFLIP
jgi:short-chain fatty acids transporter